MPALLLAATPNPSPSPLPQADPSLGSPGFIGFVFTFVLALALIALVLSMSRQLRRVNRNARLAAAAEEGARTAQAADGAPHAVAGGRGAGDEPATGDRGTDDASGEPGGGA